MMANYLSSCSHYSTILVISISIIILLSNSFPATGDGHVFGQTVDDPKHTRLKKQKLSHLTFFWHDIRSGGGNATSVTVVHAPRNHDSNRFGSANVFDNRLTIRPDRASKIVGWSQGVYASTSQQEVSLLMVMNFAFVEGKYNGSTISVIGRNPISEKVREMPVVGGSGLFRYARGYALATTRTLNVTSRDAVVQYDIYVSHY